MIRFKANCGSFSGRHYNKVFNNLKNAATCGGGGVTIGSRQTPGGAFTALLPFRLRR